MNIFDKFKKLTADGDESDSEMKYKLSEEVAFSEIKRILDFYEIDPEKDFDEDYKKIFENSINRAVKAIRLGRLEIDDKNGTFKVVQHMRSGRKEDDLVYRELDGRAKLSMANVKANDAHGKIYEVMGTLSNVGSDGIAKLKSVDLSLCEVLGSIFLSC